jgi:hypothetical protein
MTTSTIDESQRYCQLNPGLLIQTTMTVEAAGAV